MAAVVFGGYPSLGLSQGAEQVQPVEYIIEDIQGPDVQVLEEGSKTWEAAQEGQVVESGDQVKTGKNSEATLTLESDTTVHMDPDSTVKVGQISPMKPGVS